MVRRVLMLAAFLGLLATMPACGRREGPEPAWERMRTAILDQRYDELTALMPRCVRRAYRANFRFIIDYHVRRDGGAWFAGMVGMSPEDLRAMDPDELVPVHLKRVLPHEYGREVLQNCEFERIEWLGADRAVVVASVETADGKVECRYEFLLSGGRWGWNPKGPLVEPEIVSRHRVWKDEHGRE